MSNTVIIKVLIPAIALGVAVVAALVLYFLLSAWWSQPPAVLGFGSGPEQPIAFPHTVHVTEAGIDCQFCHRTVSTDEAASIPAVAQCMFCHDFSKIDGSERSEKAEAEIAKLIGELGSVPEPVNWVRVHRLPDSVQFVHSPHIEQGISCSTCHGDVGSMEVVKQVRNLKMRDCVDCHRTFSAPTDCTTCHY
ncbi:MAG: cytochrome c3 family protein [Dehalococcoidia bacterium]